MAARVAAVCAALAGLRIAHAGDRRPVAVVSLTDDTVATQLAKRLYDQLQVHWALRSLGEPTLDVALEGPLVADDDEDEHLKSAKEDLARAEDFLSQFDYARATSEATGAQSELLWVSPDRMTALYADATLVLDVEAYNALLCGRWDAPRALDAGRLRLEGDEQLGRRVADSLAYLF